MPAYVLGWVDRDIQGTVLGTITFLGLLLGMLVQPISGWLTDRIGRLPLMLLGAGVSALGVLLLMAADCAVQML